MTDWEKAVIMAYTGVVMLTGDKFNIFHRYVQEKMGRPVWTHELAGEEMSRRIKEAAKSDFLALCADEEQHFWPSPESAPKKRCCENCIYHKINPYAHDFVTCHNHESTYFTMITTNIHRCDKWEGI